ncbi:MAG: GIY-YIG nuclease family protein [Bacteroidales bacterium]|nr:GIY-YIG nuclease family protein [Bacteroidales bacterium]
MSKNFDKETFPEIDYNDFIKELVDNIELNKSVPVRKLYKKEKAKYKGDYIDKYFFQDEKFIKAFNEFSKDELSELMGVYIFSEQDSATKKNNPVYIGISRDLRRRMADHLIRKNKESATWANLMEEKEYHYNLMPLYEKHPNIENLKVYFHRIEKDINKKTHNFKLHLAEILLVLHFKPKWNSFKTH